MGGGHSKTNIRQSNYDDHLAQSPSYKSNSDTQSPTGFHRDPPLSPSNTRDSNIFDTPADSMAASDITFDDIKLKAALAKDGHRKLDGLTEEQKAQLMSAYSKLDEKMQKPSKVREKLRNCVEMTVVDLKRGFFNEELVLFLRDLEPALRSNSVDWINEFIGSDSEPIDRLSGCLHALLDAIKGQRVRRRYQASTSVRIRSTFRGKFKVFTSIFFYFPSFVIPFF